MTFLNQFHKEAMERTMRKIEESKKSPMNSKDFAGQEDRGKFEIEQRVAEHYAKSVGMWISMDEVFDLGMMVGV